MSHSVPSAIHHSAAGHSGERARPESSWNNPAGSEAAPLRAAPRRARNHIKPDQRVPAAWQPVERRSARPRWRTRWWRPSQQRPGAGWYSSQLEPQPKICNRSKFGQLWFGESHFPTWRGRRPRLVRHPEDRERHGSQCVGAAGGNQSDPNRKYKWAYRHWCHVGGCESTKEGIVLIVPVAQ